MANFQKIYKRYIKKVAPFYLLQGAISPIQAACILVYVIFFVIAGDKSQIGLYASLTIASTALADSLNDAAGSIMQMLQCIANGEKVAEFFEADSEIEPVKENALPAPEGNYEVEFKNVSFGYENTAFAIKDLNLHINPGQRIAIVGENGAGKTTLTKLLLRLYDVNNGSVLINGRDIKNNKPAPDIYLKGAELLGISPSECLVVEDAKNGILAAKAAGMMQCAVTTTFSAKELAESVAPDFITDDVYGIIGLIRDYNIKNR